MNSIKREDGLTLLDLVEFAEEHDLRTDKIYLLGSDALTITVASFDDDIPDLWYLEDDENSTIED